MTTDARARIRRASRSGFTVLEVLVAIGLLMLVLFGCFALTSAGTHYFTGTAGAALAEADITTAARLVASELAQARDYAIADDGQSITYYNNDTAYPPGQDPTPHRFYRSDTRLLWTDRTRPVLTDVPTSDGGATLVLFGPAGTQAKDGNFVTVTLVTRRSHGSGTGLRDATQRTLVRVAARNYRK